MKNIAFYLALVLFLSSCDWFKKKDENSNETYTISGTMYAADGKTLLAGKTLYFHAFSKATVKNANIRLGTTTTDSLGKFSITYKHFTQSQTEGITIDQLPEELPVYGPFLRNIPINQNIARDICLIPKIYYKFRIVVKSTKSITDSLYLVRVLIPEFKKIPANYSRAATAISLAQIQPIYESEIFTDFSDANYETINGTFHFTTSRRNFEKVFGVDVIDAPKNWKDYISEIDIKTEAFPIVNTREIIIP